MEVERIERVLGVIYPDGIPKAEYKKTIEILAEIGLMIQCQHVPAPVSMPAAGSPKEEGDKERHAAGSEEEAAYPG